MFYLTDTDNEAILDRDGLPFVYSTRLLAELGRKALAKHLKRQLLVRED